MVNVDLAAVGPGGVVVWADPGTSRDLAGCTSLDILAVALQYIFPTRKKKGPLAFVAKMSTESPDKT